MKIGSTIILNKFEFKIAEVMGKHRYRNNRKKGVENVKVGKQSNEFTDINSSAGEIAFGKFFNLYPDFDLDHHPKYDYIYNLRTVDVKTTKYNNGKLLATLKCAKKPCDLYVLIIGNLYESPTFKFCGFIRRQNFFKEENIGDLGYGNTYFVEQGDLISL